MNTLARPMPSIGTFLRLGRVSNLPTVWTNVLAGAMLGGADMARAGTQVNVLVAMAAMTALYVAGMYLNDAFDRAIDARERPTRPIPAGEIAAASVFAIGFGLMTIGLVLIARFGTAAALSGCALAATIVLYDCWHKANKASPLIMGLCRALVYVAAAAAMGARIEHAAVLLGAAAVFAHVVGLTYAAKQESLDRVGRLWPLAVLAMPLALYGGPVLLGSFGMGGALTMGALVVADVVALRLLIARVSRGDVPKAVAQLIAATSLVDGAGVVAAGGSATMVIACLCAYGATRILQRVIPGT
jgi:hypothetical protein